MAKHKPHTTTPPDAPAAGPLDAPHTEIEYSGPPGQDSPVLGALVVGARYQVNVTFGTYLCETHPDYWKRPSA